jgi:hypothetical protein
VKKRVFFATLILLTLYMQAFCEEHGLNVIADEISQNTKIGRQDLDFSFHEYLIYLHYAA